MDERSKKNYLNASKVMERYENKIWQYDGVLSIGIGPKIVGGHRTEEIAIVIGVKNKRPRSELSADQLIPEEIEHTKTDIRHYMSINPASSDQSAGDLTSIPLPEERYIDKTFNGQL